MVKIWKNFKNFRISNIKDIESDVAFKIISLNILLKNICAFLLIIIIAN